MVDRMNVTGDLDRFRDHEQAQLLYATEPVADAEELRRKQEEELKQLENQEELKRRS